MKRLLLLLLLCVLIPAAYAATMLRVTPNGTVIDSAEITTFNFNNGVLIVTMDTIFSSNFEE